MSARGKMFTTRELKTIGQDFQVTTKTKPKYAHVVFVLDTVEMPTDYSQAAAFDSLNSMGWVQFDDVMRVLGKPKAMEVVEYVTKRNEKALKEFMKKKDEKKGVVNAKGKRDSKGRSATSSI